MTERKRTKAEDRAYVEMLINLNEQKVWFENFELKEEFLPRDWQKMDSLAPTVPEKTKVTLRIDAATVRFFKAMGTGWHDRMNRVLQTYMQARLSKEIERRTDRDWLGDPL
ncbi:MAG: BrnA antitoxin family protein [Pseudomonadota bacterium]